MYFISVNPRKLIPKTSSFEVITKALKHRSLEPGHFQGPISKGLDFAVYIVDVFGIISPFLSSLLFIPSDMWGVHRFFGRDSAYHSLENL